MYIYIYIWFYLFCFWAPLYHLRYSSIHSPTLYGKTVHKLLGGIERQLRDTPPQRGALLRLVKDIAEFHMSRDKGKPI